MADILDYFGQTDYMSFGVIAALPCAVIAIYGFIQIASAITSGKNETMQRFNNRRSQPKCSNNYQNGNQYNSNNNISNNNGNNSNMDINNILSNGIVAHNNYGRQNGRKQRPLNAELVATGPVAPPLAGNAPASRKRSSTDAQWCEGARGRGTSYNAYAGRFMSSCAEDKLLERHNRGHRNSTSSEATGSEDINSSHESLINKKLLSSRQRRQLRRQQQQQQQQQQQSERNCVVDGRSNETTNKSNGNVSNVNLNGNNNNNNGFVKQVGKTFQNRDFSLDCYEVLTRKEQMANANAVGNNISPNNINNNNNKRTAQQQTQQQQQNTKAARGKNTAKQQQHNCNRANNNSNNNNNNSVKRSNNFNNKQNNSNNANPNNSNKYTKNHQQNNNSNNINNINNNNNNNANNNKSNVNNKGNNISSLSSSNSSSAVSSPTSSANSSPSVPYKMRSTQKQRRNNNNNHSYNYNANYAMPPLRQYERLNMKDTELVQYLRRYVIDSHLLRVYGFPVESVMHEGAIEIFKCHPYLNTMAAHTAAAATATAIETPKPTVAVAVAAQPTTEHGNDNANKKTSNKANKKNNNNDSNATSVVAGDGTPIANETIINCNDGLSTNSFEYNNADMSVAPTAAAVANGISPAASTDSGNVSPRSLDSDASCDWSECEQNQPGYDVGSDEHFAAVAAADGDAEYYAATQQSLAKQCTRCKAEFLVDEATGQYLTREECIYHWGKYQSHFDAGDWFTRWTCCNNEDATATGCSIHDLHVWNGSVVGMNGPYSDFVHTQCPSDGDDVVVGAYDECDERKPLHQRRVFALDCEMSYTGRGLDVTKVTVVGINGQLVYEHFVRPDADVIDYNTRFSGVTAADLNRSKGVKSLAEVQRDLLQLIDADTILIGHGLDNDLRALRIVHKTLIDTSIAFPHNSGFPYRRALKHLTKMHLKREIQCGDGHTGHSSFEDSRACMELMLWRIRKELDGLWQYD